MAPEYVRRGSVSPKIDIFSFGVLVLEIVTKRSNCSSDEHGTVNLLSDVSELLNFASFCICFDCI
jgi:serine/threonine protein kinase